VNTLLHNGIKLGQKFVEKKRNQIRAFQLKLEKKINRNKKANLHDCSNYRWKREEPASAEHFCQFGSDFCVVRFLLGL
jgi:hypothetical protein